MIKFLSFFVFQKDFRKIVDKSSKKLYTTIVNIKNIKEKIMIKVLSLFSGIGAFEKYWC